MDDAIALNHVATFYSVTKNTRLVMELTSLGRHGVIYNKNKSNVKIE